MTYRLWEKMNSQEREKTLAQAEVYLSKINEL